LSKVDLLIAAIEKREGFGVQGTLPTRLNNPGDLLFRKQPGALPYHVLGRDGVDRVYAEFDTLANGVKGLRNQIALDATFARHETLREFVHKWAPASDGNPETINLEEEMKALGVTNPDILLAEALKD
jgi:hypothetical protein